MSEDGRKISGGIVLSTEGSDAYIPDLSPDIIRAIHQTVIGKKERITIRKHEFRRLDSNDISQLINQIEQWLSPLQIVSKDISIACRHRSNQSGYSTKNVVYKSIDSLIKHEGTITDPIGEVVIQISIIYFNQDKQIVEPVDFEIQFTSLYEHPSYIEDEDLSDFEYDLSTREVSISIYCEYADYIMARNGTTLIEEWYRSIEAIDPFRKPGFILRLLNVREFHLRPSLSSGWIMFSVISSGLWIYTVSFEKDSFLNDPLLYGIILYITMSIILSILFYYIRYLFVSKIYMSNRVPLLCITEGDRRRIKKFENNLATSRKWKSYWFVTVASGLAVGVFSGIALRFF